MRPGEFHEARIAVAERLQKASKVAER